MFCVLSLPFPPYVAQIQNKAYYASAGIYGAQDIRPNSDMEFRTSSFLHKKGNSDLNLKLLSPTQAPKHVYKELKTTSTNAGFKKKKKRISDKAR